MLDTLGPGWVRVDALSNFLQTQIVGHAGIDDADELASWSTNCSRAKHIVGALCDMHFDEPFLAFTDGTIEPRKWLSEGRESNVALLHLPRVKTDVSDLGLCIGRPG